MDEETIHNYIADYCDNIEVHRLVVRVVSRLPESVQQFVCHRCILLALSDVGMVLPGRITHADTHDTVAMVEAAPIGAQPDDLHDYVEQFEQTAARWIILLQGSPPQDESVIAHEIAHAYLGHDRLGISVGLEPVAIETQACELTRSWGFEGLGTDIDHCTGPYRDSQDDE